MSIRDWFAGQAMAAIVTLGTEYDHSGAHDEGLSTGQSIAREAYRLADAMLAARAVTP